MELNAILARLGGEPLPSTGDFVAARIPAAAWVRDVLVGLGAEPHFLKSRSAFTRPVWFRCPGDEIAFARLAHGLETALAPEAVLFDMDDTLVDATASYRRATIATAATFGVSVTPLDITAAKAAGGANDDWELTYRLVARAGAKATLAEVTRRFEALYQGTPSKPGLRAAETMLVEPSILRRLARRVKLGVVTGRPRSDALRSLTENNLRRVFRAVVTMDDGPLKPDPAPVRLALEKLGVTRAWMAGDTPDDVRAALGAGVIPLGVIAPSDDPAVARAALEGAGAVRVLGSLAEIEALLASVRSEG
ncbi:MAG: HAD-IA family hydrolase [Deltaproteobacteria bacterium]|nr:HAD-IA family hydrolase [Deltaproteobacteria bacterium]